jgi:hypothetical protein
LEAQFLASKPPIGSNKLPPNPYEGFIERRKYMGVGPRTVEIYQDRLSRFKKHIGNPYKAKREDIIAYLNTIQPNKIGYSSGTTRLGQLAVWLNGQGLRTRNTKKLHGEH